MTRASYPDDPYSEGMAARGRGFVERDIDQALETSGRDTKWPPADFLSPRLISETGAVAKVAEKVPLIGAFLATGQPPSMLLEIAMQAQGK